MKLLKKLVKKHKSFIMYGIFGVLTTLVNMVVFHVCYHRAGIGNILSNVFAWILAVTFAYVTNKIWVFDSKSFRWSVLKREVIAFLSCRLISLVLDLAIMYVCVDVMKWHPDLMKAASNVLVIIVNYIFSKLIIFKKR